MSFEKAISDGVQIGAIGRQEQEPAAVCLQDCGGFVAFVSGQIVENDDGAGFQFGQEDLLDAHLLSVESLAVHGARYDPGGD